MTNKEAKLVINSIKFILDNAYYSDDVENALNMAISALEGEGTDAPSRKGVFIPDITVEMFRNASLEGVEDLMASGEMEDISLPSAQSERKTGKWVHGREIAREMVGDAITAIFYEGWQCSECKCIVEEEREPLWKFCPNCGAEMKGE